MNALFREVTRRICSSLQLDEALFEVFDYLKDQLPLDAVIITVYEYETKTARIITAAYALEGVLINQSFPLSDRAWDTIKKWQKESKSATTPWIRDETNPINREIKKILTRMMPREFLWKTSQYSSMTCALKVKNEIVGNLTFVAGGYDRYNISHADIIAEVNEPFAIALSNALRYMALEQNNLELQKEAREVRGHVMIGANHGLKMVKQLIEQVSPTMSHVLLQGETGTGKEVVANEIHKLSPRSKGPLICLNCGAIPDTLIDSELFGHEKGAFTGALETRPGRFERADKGTLFLDEVGELPLAAQTKLLRVLQTGEFERVGGRRVIKSNARLICATHRNLEQMIRDGQFRKDLWYRLNVFPITIPPLRERVADIPAILAHFIQAKCQEMNFPRPPGLAPEALENLTSYAWPGNVRELQNLIERALIISRGGPLYFPQLGENHHDSIDLSLIEPKKFFSLDEAVAAHIKLALSRSRGKIAGENGAAQLLSIHPNTLRSRMKKLEFTKSPILFHQGSGKPKRSNPGRIPGDV